MLAGIEELHFITGTRNTNIYCDILKQSIQQWPPFTHKVLVGGSHRDTNNWGLKLTSSVHFTKQICDYHGQLHII